jgi:hypothetical protein
MEETGLTEEAPGSFLNVLDYMKIWGPLKRGLKM